MYARRRGKWQHAKSGVTRFDIFHGTTSAWTSGNAASWTGTATSAPDLPVGAPAETSGTHRSGTEDQCPVLRLAHRNLTFGPAGTDRDISRHNASARSETLGPNAITKGSRMSVSFVLAAATRLNRHAICSSNSGRGCASVCARERCAIISDSNVAPLFADRVKKSLTSAGFRPTLITIPAGEKSKTLKQAGAICDRMIAAGLDRQSFVVGLGGGMIGDISGFVAAIYHRGIPHVQIPTTLLAMVDSSIGGKTGVDTRAGKNLIGAFHQPSLVIDDLDVLKTLPRRQFNQGFAEIIKHAIIADAKMFRMLAVVEGRAQRLRYNS